MKASELRQKNPAELQKELLSLAREHFNMRVQRATGQLTTTHRLGDVRRGIARIKTILAQKAGQ